MNKNILENNTPFIIGMAHCLPLPGTKDYEGDMERIINHALKDAMTLEKAGVDAIIVENMGDTPFAQTLDMEQAIALSVVSAYIKKSVSVPIGIDAAFNDYKASIAAALAIGGDFVRIPVFVDTVAFYGGVINPCARECILYRKKLNAEHIKIFADIQVKHTHMVFPQISIEESAKNALSCGADAIIVTGAHIGAETPIDIIKRVKNVVDIKVIAGSGVNEKNIKNQLSIAHGAIIGSSLKKGGTLSENIDYNMTKKLIDAYKEGA